MLQCKENPENWELCRELLVPIYKKHNLDPIIRILLSEYIKNPEVPISEVYRQHHIIDFRPYARVIKQQKQIGWKQLRYGRWTKGWAEIQYRYEIATTGTPAQTATYPKWISAIIQELWKFQRTRWKARNNKTHKDATYNHTKQNLMTRIRGIYSKQSQLRQQDQFPFHRSLEEWAEYITTEISLWINRNVPFIKYCLKVNQVQSKRGTTDIRKFFSTGTTQTKFAKRSNKRKKNKKEGSKKQEARGIRIHNQKEESLCKLTKT